MIGTAAMSVQCLGHWNCDLFLILSPADHCGLKCCNQKVLLHCAFAGPRRRELQPMWTMWRVWSMKMPGKVCEMLPRKTGQRGHWWNRTRQNFRRRVVNRYETCGSLSLSQKSTAIFFLNLPRCSVATKDFAIMQVEGTISFDFQGVILCEFFQPGKTITAELHCKPY